MMTSHKESRGLANPLTADEAIASFLETPENERLYRESEIRLDIAEAMRALRKAQGITQEQLAERVGCSQPFIAKLEKGAYDRFGMSSLRTYARALGCDINVEAMFRPISAAIFSGASSSAAVQEALEYEEVLSPKLASAFAKCSTTAELTLRNDLNEDYESAA